LILSHRFSQIPRGTGNQHHRPQAELLRFHLRGVRIGTDLGDLSSTHINYAMKTTVNPVKSMHLSKVCDETFIDWIQEDFSPARMSIHLSWSFRQMSTLVALVVVFVENPSDFIGLKLF
jgi:hypothetical protein